MPSIGVGGIKFYTGSLFPEFKNALLIGSLKFQYLSYLPRDENGFGKEKNTLNEHIIRKINSYNRETLHNHVVSMFYFFSLRFGLWTLKLVIFDLNFGFSAKNPPQNQLEPCRNPNLGKNMPELFSELFFS